MPFSLAVRKEALVRSGRHCCICHRFVGLKIEVHHIEPEAIPSNNTIDNAISLCFDCHADMINYVPKHPKGTKYSFSDLKRHRDNWYSRLSSPLPYPICSKNYAADICVFKWIINQLPWSYSLRMIARFDPRDGYQWGDMLNLISFLEQCGNPLYSFLDADLEGLRATFTVALESFVNDTTANTASAGDSSGRFNIASKYVTMPTAQLDLVATDLISAAEITFNHYKTLITECKFRLLHDVNSSVFVL